MKKEYLGRDIDNLEYYQMEGKIYRKKICDIDLQYFCEMRIWNEKLEEMLIINY